jgi:hypothetical protein
MAEGFDDSVAPVARGRRDPELAFALEAENGLGDAGEDNEVEVIGLLPGDGIIAKVTISHKTDVGDGWFTYGVQTRVHETENEEEAFMRVADVVNTRVIDLASDMLDRITSAQPAQQPPRAGQMRPQQR